MLGSKVNCSQPLHESFNLSEPQFPLLWNGGKTICPSGVVGGINAHAVLNVLLIVTIIRAFNSLVAISVKGKMGAGLFSI